jgi:hypothetical protein
LFLAKVTFILLSNSICHFSAVVRIFEKTVANKALPPTRRANPRKGSTRRVCVSATVVRNFLYINNMELAFNPEVVV